MKTVLHYLTLTVIRYTQALLLIKLIVQLNVKATAHLTVELTVG